MRVTLVLRSDEWLSSVALHLQLFSALGFPEIQKYAHIAPLLKLDGNSKRKLSKRKDPEASVVYYMEQGYPSTAVKLYLKGLANSDLADLAPQQALDAPIRLERMQSSGALIDFAKLNDLSADFVATLPPSEVRQNIFEWAEVYDSATAEIIRNKWDYTVTVIETDRITDGKIRKDLYRWADFVPLYGFLYPELFGKLQRESLSTKQNNETLESLWRHFIERYRESSDPDDWFDNWKNIASAAGFALDKKAFREEPTKYKGTLGDATAALRIVLTGKRSGFSLFAVCKTLGKEEVLQRIFDEQAG